ncbi:uncharacterized protein DNG_05647 [Cephalotrichum gorgonifer]|uniref:Uncharacterized protein n=1 Tax=Cephalotrichum gorgonifer TaxID=2041049 RepID=A0AAE8MYC6_9PEZI|nr:uncharacterized protein DNG_05647 [Cephalotrichum gorgonifer]
MAKTAAGKESKLMVPASPPTVTTTPTTIRSRSTATTPTNTNPNPKHIATAAPVQIPRSKWEPTKASSDRHDRHRTHRPRDVYSPGAIPPSIHALLAGTTIPRPRNARAGHKDRRRPPEKEKEKEIRDSEKDESLTLDAVIQSQQVPDKELSLSLGKSPLDLLLDAPDFLGDDDDEDDDDNGTSFSDSLLGSLASTLASTLASARTVSAESVPSLTACSASPFGTSPSTDSSPLTPPLLCRRRGGNSQFVSRPSLEPVSPSSAGGDPVAHPLSTEVKIEELDFRVFQQQPAAEDGAGTSVWDSAFSRLPLKSAFKSNLTASLRAIRSAAKSFSTLSLASIPPDDLLTRSILAIDPRVPYTDERRPPVLEEEPSAALRRYLNPTTRSRVEDSAAGALPRPPRQYIATIQMQTYKIERLRENARLSRLPVPVTPRAREPGSAAPAQQAPAPVLVVPAMRQREMRENPDFIRVAVLEMAMRRRGKLDDERPGRARWALPPRKAITREYEVGEDGVPARWVPVAC